MRGISSLNFKSVTNLAVVALAAMILVPGCPAAPAGAHSACPDGWQYDVRRHALLSPQPDRHKSRHAGTEGDAHGKTFEADFSGRDRHTFARSQPG